MIRLALILATLFTSLPGFAHSGLMKEAGDALARGDKAQAIEYLKVVPASDEDYPASLLESAKIYYGEGKFSHFFPLAGYLRKVYGESDAAEEARFLESMALIRHCHYEEAKTRLNEILHSSTYHEVVEHWLQALSKAKLPKTTVEDGTGRLKIFHEVVEWPVNLNEKNFKKFNPYELRRAVKSNCQGGVVQ